MEGEKGGKSPLFKPGQRTVSRCYGPSAWVVKKTLSQLPPTGSAGDATLDILRGWKEIRLRKIGTKAASPADKDGVINCAKQIQLTSMQASEGRLNNLCRSVK